MEEVKLDESKKYYIKWYNKVRDSEEYKRHKSEYAKQYYEKKKASGLVKSVVRNTPITPEERARKAEYNHNYYKNKKQLKEIKI